MLSFIIWFPIFAAILLMVLPRSRVVAGPIAAGVSLLVLVFSLEVFWTAQATIGRYALERNYIWLPSIGIYYHIGVNSFSALLVLLTAIVGFAAVLVSKPTHHENHYFALVLTIIGGLIGAFASLDLFFLYIFHEFSLIPSFILIGVWGADNRRRAAMKMTIYLGLGSLILLFGLLALYGAAGANSFDLIAIQKKVQMAPIAMDTQIWLFALLFLGFGILISVFPFHTWAPIGYGEAPAAVAMLHAGVIKKFGLFGLYVVAVPLLPEGFTYWKPLIVWMAAGNLIYCGYVALAQKDVRYLFSYASISHMGYAFLALCASTSSRLAIGGFTLFLFAHGLAAALSFAAAGACRDLTGTAEISSLGGLAKKMPFVATMFTMAAFAAAGLPGFGNFASEIMIFFGSFASHPWLTLAALWTVVISAVYLLRATRNIFFGPIPASLQQCSDAGFGRRIGMTFLVITLLAAGFFPNYFLGQLPSVPNQAVAQK